MLFPTAIMQLSWHSAHITETESGEPKIKTMVPYHLESTKISLHCIALYFMSIYTSYLCPSTHDDKNESVLMFLAMLYVCCKRPLVYRLRSSNILVIIVRLLFLNILFVQFISTELYNKGLSPIVLHCKKSFYGSVNRKNHATFAENIFVKLNEY